MTQPPSSSASPTPSTPISTSSKPPSGSTRTVCCAIPVDRESGEVLMVTSRKHATKWIFPKGGLEEGETLLEAAIRESNEEAGTPAKLPSTPLNLQSIYQGTCLTKDGQRKIDYHIFEIEVAKKDLDENWLEQTERLREWVPVSKALRRLEEWTYTKKSKIEMGEALKKTRIYTERCGELERTQQEGKKDSRN